MADATITWSNLSIAAGATETLTFDVVVNAPGDGVSFSNVASVEDADQFDPDSEPGNDPDSDGDGLIGSEDNNPNDSGIDPDDEDDADDEPVEPRLLSIGSNVFVDNNNDGMRDGDEVGIEGITVQIFNTGADGIAENADDELVGEDVTDANGDYFVGDLLPGDYYGKIMDVDADYPASSTPTSLDPNDNTDGDDNGLQSGGIGTGVWSNVITLSPGDEPTVEPGSGGDQDDADDANGNMTLDFGFAPLVSIGSNVFADNNDNGVKDDSEPGIEGVLVEVFNLGPDGIAENGDDEKVGEDITDGSGDYFVGDLVPGEYYVKVPTPDAGYPVSSTDIGSTPDADGNIDNDDNGIQTDGPGAMTWSNVVELLGDDEPTNETGSGGNQDAADDNNGNMTVDFGFVPYVSLGSNVFVDANNNGVRDGDEDGIEGVTVQVFNTGADGIAENADDELVGEDVTDENGDYFVDELLPGDYYVKVMSPSADFPISSTDIGSTANPNGDVDNDDNGLQTDGPGAGVWTNVITLEGDDEPVAEPGSGGDQDVADDNNGNMTLDLGFFAPAKVEGLVFKNCDEPGVQNGSETPAEGAIVSLTNAANGTVFDVFGNAVESIETGSDGTYSFDNLLPGEYKVSFTVPTSPSGLDFSPADLAADDIDSDADPDTGMAPAFTLESGDVVDNIDAGLIDVEAPTFTVPADTMVECDGDKSPAATGDVTDEADNCAVNLDATFTDVEDYDECGGMITRTWTLVDDCGNETVQVQEIMVKPAPEPTITVPAVPTTLTCEEAAAFTAPDASYSNGVAGTCEISGTVPAVVNEDFDICGGTITITWIVPAPENCDRSGVEETVVINITPAEAPVITIPAGLPTELTCEEAAAFVIPDASYSNGAADANCLIEGTQPGQLTEAYDECGGDITITWTVPTGCDNESVTESITIPVTPAAAPTITLPTLPSTLTCDEAAAFTPPSASYSNGETGSCEISGITEGVKVENFDICGGTITVTYTVEPGDNCEREAVVETVEIPVTPAPAPEITIPTLPGSLTCGEVATFVIPDASYTNNAVDASCLISGTTPGAVVESYDECGGEITITWTVETGCDNVTVTESATIPVLPAPEPVITLPAIPSTLTCDEAAAYTAPDASYSNGAAEPCLISGTAAPEVVEDFDICGGTITITYTVDPGDNCERSGVEETVVINVEPAPAPTITIPTVPGSLTCEEAAVFSAPDASYSNNAASQSCLISGTEAGVISESYDQCGGTITITWTVGSGCDNSAVQESVTIPVEPAAAPTITIPSVPGSLTCDEAASFAAPQASYTNGENGTCAIAGVVDGVLTPDFDICGGTITITWTVEPGDNCDRPAVVETTVIEVLPAPLPEIVIPNMPGSLTCEEAAAFNAPDATYSNNATSQTCLIAGTTPGSVTEAYDQCGGTITVTWTVSTGCDNESVQESMTIPVEPAANPTVQLPTLPSSLTCDEAAAYVAPNASYSNGETGTCEISGTVSGVKTENFDICGGTITITYTVEPGDNCDRPAVVETVDIPVTPAPAPTITIPTVPGSLTCEEAAAFNAPDASYSNNAASQTCLISGTTPGVVSESYDQCGGTITITWTVGSGCDNSSVQESVTIPVEPAANPEIALPTLPSSLTCDEAAAYVAPNASYSNGETGTCEISGTVSGVKTENFDICGGTITITYTVEPGDNCDRPAVVETVDIPVTPAPAPTITIPTVPGSLTCEEAAAFNAPDASYSNNAASQTCLISGTTPGVVSESYDQCGGTITITWTVGSGCDNSSVQESVTIPVEPAANPTVQLPTLPTSLTCDEAAAYVAPDASYSNGETGTCEISGTVSGVKTENFDICGGTITITYTVQPGDNCNRPAVTETVDIPVTPAPSPIITVPAVPSSLTCEEAAVFNAPDASYSNNAASQSCLISGIAEGVVTGDYDQCGGTITITWTTSTGCDNSSVQESVTIPVEPAANPEIALPTLPSSLTCDEAAAYVAPNASYSNGQTGTCEISGTVSGVKTENFNICGGTITITYTVQPGDNCNRPAIVETVDIPVTPAPTPTISIPTVPSSLTCEEAAAFNAPDASYSNNAASQTCLISGTAEGIVTDDFDQCGGTITITWTASTGCDNQSVQESVTIPVEPAANPEITLPAAPASLTCDEAAAYVAPNASYSNGSQGACLISGTVSGVKTENFDICGGTITITYTVQPGDNCNRPAVVETMVIPVTPAPNPTISVPTVPGSLTCEEAATYDAPDASYSNNATSQSCLISGTAEGVVSGDFDQCGGTITITWTTSTGCDNSSVQESVTIPVEPAANPEIMLPAAPASLTCDEAAAYVAPNASYSNGETGTCEISGTVSGVKSENFDICGGTITITYTVEPGDNCNRPAVVETMVIPVAPAPTPTISVPTVPSSLTCEEAATYDAPDASYSNNATSQSCLISGTAEGIVTTDFDQCGGTITITWTTGTGCDNSSVQETRTINVTPAASPNIVIPNLPLSLTCDEAASFAVPSASFSNGNTGTCEISGTVQGTKVDNFTICGGEITITWTIDSNDNCGRPVTESATIPVTPAPTPTITIPALPPSLSCEDVSSFVAPDASYTNGASSASCLISGTAVGVIENNFDQCGGTITITWTTPTGCDNSSIQEQATIRVDGPGVPVISCPTTLTLECDDAEIDRKISDWLATATATAGCGASVSVTNNYDQVSFSGGCSATTGTKLITFTATDECGSQTTCTAMIEVVDNNDPVWTINPEDITLECSDPQLGSKVQAWVNSQGGGSATDVCSNVGYTSDFRSFDRNCDGTTTVTFTATDDCGNSEVASAVITIIDASDPVILNVEPDIVVDCGEAYNFSNPTVSDNCDTDIGLEMSDSGDLDPCQGGTIIRTWTATDECGNVASESQRVTLTPDNAGPTFTSALPSNITVSCDNIPAAAVVTAEDCNGAVLTFNESESIVQCGKIITRTWTFTDACNNTVSHTQTITVECPLVATVAPTGGVNCNNPDGGSATVTVTGGQPGYIYAWDNGETGATATNLDNGVHTVVVTDASGCTETLSVTIEGDFTEPTVSAQGGTITCDNTSVTLSATTNGTITGWTGPNGFSSSQASPSVSVAGTYTVSVEAANGCTSTATAVVNEDTQTPSVSATGGTITCTTTSVQLAASTNGTVVGWTGPAGFTSSQASPSVSVAGTYTVTVESANGCTATATATVNEDTTPPTVSAQGGSLSCGATSVNLTATTNGTITGWTGPNGFSSSQASPSVSAPGTYTVSVVSANGCTATATATVTEDVTPPSITATGGTITCSTTSITLNATTNGTITGWTGPNGFTSSQASPSVSVPGTYTVTAQSGNGCTATATATVTEDTVAPTVSATGGEITCDVTSVILTATTNGTVTGWTGPNGFTSSQAAPSVSVTGTYTVTVQGANGCTATATATVSGDTTAPTVSATGGTVTCSTTSVTLSATTNGSVVGWTGPNGFTSSLVTPSVQVPGTYTVTVEGPNGCTATATATVNSDTTAPSVSTTGGSISCNNGSVTLTATTNGSVVGWTGPNGFTSSQTSPSVTVAGTYTVTVQGSNGCTATATATVTGDTTPPTVSAVGGTISCTTTSITLSATTNGTIVGWTGPNGFTSSQASPSVSTVGTYTVTVQGANGCTATATAVVNGDTTAPSVTATGGTITCDATSVTLNASTNGTIVGWTGPNGFTSNQASPSVSVTGTYTVTVQSANGCTATASAVVNGDTTTPSVTATGGTLTCTTTSVNISATTNGTIVGWTGPNGFTSNQASPSVTVAGTYTVTVQSANGCTATASATVNSDTTTPSVSATGGTITCDVTSVTLGATTNGTIVGWTGPGGFTSAQAAPSVSVAGTYTVTVQSANGCTATATAQVGSDTTAPTVSATGGVITCNATSVTLNATTNGTIVGWTGPNGFTSSQSAPSVSAVGTYTVTVESANGCTATATAQVTGDTTAPSVSATGGTITCTTTSVTLNASTNGTIVGWTGPNGFTSNQASPSVSATGTYTVTVTNANGCTATATASVDSDTTAPTVSATGGTISCNATSVVLSVTTNGTVVGWTGPNGFTSNQANPSVTATGTYTVTVQSANGCTATASAQVTGDTTAPTVSATGGTITCDATSVTLNASTNGTIVGWTGPGGFTSAQAAPSVSVAGTYTVTVESANGCTATASAVVSSDTTAPTVSATGGQLSCDVAGLALTATTNGTIVGWTGPNGFTSTQASPVVSTVGTYTVTVEGANGCTAIATAQVTGDTTVPTVSATGGQITCDVTSVTLGVTSNGSVIGWTGPNGFTSTQTNPVVSTTGTYTVTVQGGNGCIATATAEVTGDTTAPTVSAAGGTISCDATSVVLGVTTNGTVVGWTGPNGFTSTQANPSVSATGTYTVTVEGTNGCTATASAQVTGDTTAPTVSATGGQITCDVTSITLNATTNGTIVGWTGPGGFTSAQASPSVNVAGTYTVTVESANGCTSTASAVVTSDTTAPTVSATGGEITCNSSSVTISATTNGTIVGWTGPNGFTSTQASPVVTETGTYTVTVEGANGCTATASAQVTGDTTVPTVSATGGQITCDVTSVTLGVTTNGTVVGWTGPNGFTSTQANPVVSATGTYTVTVEGANGCTATASAEVTGDTTAPSVTATGGTITCDVTSVVLSTTTNGTVVGWTGPNGFTSTQANPSVSATGTYTVTVENANGCTASASATVDADTTPPSVSASASGRVGCDGQGVTLTATTEGRIISWTGPNGFASSSASPVVTLPGTYIVNVEGANGCLAGASVTVLGDSCTPAIAINKLTNGEEFDIILMDSDDMPVVWTYEVTNTGDVDLTNVVVNDDQEGQIGVIANLPAGASETLSATGTAIMGRYDNKATVTGNYEGQTVMAMDESYYIGVFINVEKIANKTEVCPGEEVEYTLITRMLGGAPGIELRDITVTDSNLPNTLTSNSPEFVASSDVANDDMIAFIDNDNDGKSDEEFVWEYTLTINEDNVNMATDMAGVYFNGIFQGMVSNNDEVTVTVNEDLCPCEDPTVSITGGTITCDNPTVQIQLTTDGESVSWTGPNGFTSSTPNPVVNTAGEYTVTVTTDECSTTSSVIIGEDRDLPTASLTGGVLTCTTTSINLNPSSNGTIVSLTGPDASTSVSNPVATVAGTYTLSVESANGCVNSASVTLTSDTQAPSVTASGGSITCASPGATLSFTSNATLISWTGPYGFSGTAANPVVSVPGVYTVTVRGSNGCEASATVTVTEDKVAPTVSATGGELSCSNGSVVIVANTNAGQVSWTGPNGFTSNVLSPTVSVAGTYTVTATASNGCTSTATATVTGDTTAPSVSATGGSITCAASTVTLSASTNGSIVGWTGPNGFTSSEASPIVNVAGTYTVTVESAGGCTATANAIVTESIDNISVIGEGIDAQCGKDNGRVNITVSGGSAPYTYAWNTGATSQNLAGLAAGTYSVVVTDANGCKGEGSVVVNAAGGDVNVRISDVGNSSCANGDIGTATATASGGVAPYTYEWSDGQTTNTAVNLPAGTYTVVVTDLNGCSTSGTITIAEDDDCNACIGDFVFEDSNRDGIQNDGEKGINRVRVRLLDETGRFIAEQLTTGNGGYKFENLQGGRYILEFLSPDGYAVTLPQRGSDPEKDSDINMETRRTPIITIDNDECNMSIDAGFYKTGSIGDLVWLDEDCDGIKDNGEPGIGNVRVELYDATGNTMIASTVTNSDGTYNFVNLAPGDFTVKFFAPDGLRFTAPDQGNNEGRDSDVVSEDGSTDVFTLHSGEIRIDIDAGLRGPDCDNPVGKIDLELTKRVNITTPQPGDTVRFQISVFNNSEVDATGVTFEDVLPNGFQVMPSGINDGGRLAGNNTVRWENLDIDALSLVRVSFEAIVLAPEAGRTYKNVAQIVAADQEDVDSVPGNDDGDQSEDDEDYAIARPEMTDVAITKTVSTSNPQVREVITYTIVVTNEGTNRATGVEITDYLPIDFCTNFTNISNNGIFLGDQILWTDLRLEAGESITLTFDATVSSKAEGTSVVNLAEVTDMDQTDMDSTPDNMDGTPSEDDESSATFTVGGGMADLELMKDVNKTQVGPNEEVEFYITVVNNGPGTAYGVIVEDIMPDGYNNVANISNNGVTFKDRIVWTIGELPVDSFVTFTFNANAVHFLDRECDYRNVAQIVSSSTDDPDSTPGNLSAVPSEDDEDFAEVEMVLEGGVCVELETAVFLEGAYIYEESRMTNMLNRLGYLPGQKPSTFFGEFTEAGQPYAQAPWFHFGTEGDDFVQEGEVIGMNAGYPMTAVDWVLVSLRSDASAASEVAKVAALLHQDGHVEFVEGFEVCNLDPTEDYYIVIEHRNHLVAMSHIELPIVNGKISYDFRAHDSYKRILGSGQKEIAPGVYAMIGGNGDQTTSEFDSRDINPNDLTKWLIDNGLSSSYFLRDMNLSGDVNVSDKALFLINNGLFSDVPK